MNETRKRCSNGLAGLLLLFATSALSQTGCSTSSLLSKQTDRSEALGQMAFTALLSPLMAADGGGDVLNQLFQEEDVYFLGVIPTRRDRDNRVDNGTRLHVNGRDRGFLPKVLSLPAPGPHVAAIHLPGFETYKIPLGEVIRLRVGDKWINAWPPLIVDNLTGEIFTTNVDTHINPDHNSGSSRKTSIAKNSKRPILIVTTTDKRHPNWRKLGQMESAVVVYR